MEIEKAIPRLMEIEKDSPKEKHWETQTEIQKRLAIETEKHWVTQKGLH